MSVDVFGRHLMKKEHHYGGIRRSPRGSFKRTLDGQYDIECKKLCNLADAMNENDAVSLKIMKFNLTDLHEKLRYVVNNMALLNKKIIENKFRIEEVHKSAQQNDLHNTRLEIELLHNHVKQNHELITQLASKLESSK